MQTFNQAYRNSLELLYIDTCTVYRAVKKPSDTSSATKLVLGPVEGLTDIPCRVSNKSLDTNEQTVAQGNITYESKLFINPDIELFSGDRVYITRNGINRKYILGEPFLYPTHQEMSIQRKEWS